MRTAAGHAENKTGRFTWRAVHRGIIGIKKHAVHKIHPFNFGFFTKDFVYDLTYLQCSIF